MAFDTFIKIATVDGESTATGMEKAIEIFSFSWGASNPTTVSSGKDGLSAGKVSISSFNIMKKTEASSTKLFQACCNGSHFANAVVTMRKATGKGGQQDFLKYTFTDVMIESVQWSGSSGGDDTPTESVSIAFAKVEVEYKTQDDKGGMKVAGQASWDLTKVAS
ncbi:MAG TPA: type VI secretion system tube protein Hcp [Gemmatimonas sp.]|uniref:Hcp family type VI secretion system effector n=1 Tax=Gemmatimonas sp. TaxID=1962908 RepID=UPI002EDAA650